MEIAILAVGKLRPSYRDAGDEYLKRLGRYATVTEREVKESGRAGSVAAQQKQEADRLTERLVAGTTVVALSRSGSPWSSGELAGQLERWLVAAKPLTLVVGGSTGLLRAFLEAVDARWSLGPLTLPHQLARVVAIEQLYRAFTILRGEPYHKGGGRR